MHPVHVMVASLSNKQHVHGCAASGAGHPTGAPATPIVTTCAAPGAVPHRVCPAIAAERGGGRSSRQWHDRNGHGRAGSVGHGDAANEGEDRGAPLIRCYTCGAKKGGVTGHRRHTRAPASAVGPTTKYTVTPPRHAPAITEKPHAWPHLSPCPSAKKQTEPQTHYASTTPSSTSALSKKSVPDGAS